MTRDARNQNRPPRPARMELRDYLKQVIYGGNDGIVTTFAVKHQAVMEHTTESLISAPPASPLPACTSRPVFARTTRFFATSPDAGRSVVCSRLFGKELA